MVKDKAWSVSTVNILSRLHEAPEVDGVLVSDLRYTVLDETHCYHGASELAELHRIDPKHAPKVYVAYKPERLALHECITAVSTTLRLADEKTMQRAAQEIHAKVTEILDTDVEIQDLRRQTQEEVTAYVASYLEGNRDIPKSILDVCEKLSAPSI